MSEHEKPLMIPLLSDKEFLLWIHERLEHVHGENPLYDYMIRLETMAGEEQDERKET